MAMDCKLCSKRFSNGKALGAHMRSHYAILPLPPKTPQRHELSEPPTESTSSVDDSKSKSKSSCLPDPDSNSDGESESGSTRARFEKAKGVVDREATMEDVASCLIMLSRDVWTKESDDSSRKIYRCEKCDKVFKSSQGLGSHKASHFKRIRKESEIVVDGDQVHECAFCPRIFKSAQALGGHKKSHFPVKKSQVLEVGKCDPFYFSSI